MHCEPYNYPKAPSLTKLQLADTQPFSTTGVDNFGPVYVQNMFNRNDCEMRKLWVTLYTIQTLSRLIEHFWDRWCKECTVNLREYHSAKQQVSSKPMIKLKDLVLFHDDCVPRYLRRTGVVTELYCSNSDNQIRGASVRVKR